MKFYFEFVNSVSSGSVYDVHMFCLYQASDCRQNMARVLRPFRDVIIEMQQSEFRMDRHKVKVFLGGDFHFIDDVLGHQGSSASYPSVKDYVELTHLQNHRGLPHTPFHCDIARRTVKDLEASYFENLAEDRTGGLRKTGKYHESIVGDVIFPITDLSRVVPPVLHIVLGITLKLYELLLKCVRRLDACDDMPSDRSDNIEWVTKSVELRESEQSLRQLGGEYVDLANLTDRLSAGLRHDFGELENISKNSSGKKRFAVNKDFGSCAAEVCLITRFDTDVNWVLCDTCEKWSHQVCELFGESEEITLERFTCLKCSGIGRLDLHPHLEKRIDDLRERRVTLDDSILELELRCKVLQTKCEETMGHREKQLLQCLDDIKVARQAYHGNVFVGNHCKVVLRNHARLCEVIADNADLHERFLCVFGLFNQIQPLLFCKRFLTDPEIDALERFCNSFGEAFPKHFPEETITRKLHELVFDVPRFAKMHRTLGLLSEEEGESLHNSVNKEVRQLYGVRDQDLKLTLLLQRQELWSKANRKLQIGVERVCVPCKGNGQKSFYRKGKCPCCGHCK
ncbi:uncharacterized protein LOC130625451 [Hydractinia symbiolongicarpus]|uniref:uncharacterized protein LOC130625451 n=1 Tax=Hydractinia symbiolongicarpus TaxID=13093 RepID=UPI002551AE7C|nr:uncharacterized protein LOC130625451 [Hydractinia symbiolongicarpus]